MIATSPLHRVLVLDDDAIMRELLQMLLAFGGYEVVLAGSGEEALDLLSHGSAVEVILSDLHMPGLEGPELMVRLRATVPRETMLIGMSGSPPGAEIRSVLDGFLAKPFDVQLFRNAVVEASAHKVREEKAADALGA